MNEKKRNHIGRISSNSLCCLLFLSSKFKMHCLILHVKDKGRSVSRERFQTIIVLSKWKGVFLTGIVKEILYILKVNFGIVRKRDRWCYGIQPFLKAYLKIKEKCTDVYSLHESVAEIQLSYQILGETSWNGNNDWDCEDHLLNSLQRCSECPSMLCLARSCCFTPNVCPGVQMQCLPFTNAKIYPQKSVPHWLLRTGG